MNEQSSPRSTAASTSAATAARRWRPSRDGRIILAGETPTGYGRTVVIDHGDGYRTLYAHNDEILVRVGDEVARGAPIARVGRTGNATAEHVHFEIRRGNEPIDPLPYLDGVLEASK